MNRFREALSLLPKRSFVGLLVLAVLLVWSLTYSATIEYIRSRGGVVEEIGHMNVLISTLDGTVLTFSLLVYLVAGVVPFVVLMFRPKKRVSYAVQAIWVATIVGLAYVSKALA